MNSFKFNLEKTYFDCIDEDGHCFIIYWAQLNLFFMRLNYAGILYSDAKGVCVEQSTLQKSCKPVIADLLQFNQSKLKFSGSWARLDLPLTLLLYTDESGNELLWQCHHPKADARIVYHNKTFRGLGYAETLTLPIKPWLLPIDELRWGRFLSKDYSVIWIHWQGRHPINKIICNGILYEDAVFEENKLSFDHGAFILSFHQPTVIRHGKLASILAKMPWLKVIFPRSILNTIEIKYKSSSSLSRDNIVVQQGWSLFEIVSWVK